MYVCVYDIYVCLLSCLAVSNSFDPRDYSPPGSSVHGISQARTLEWVAVPSFRGSSRPGYEAHTSHVSAQAGGRVFANKPPRKPQLSPMGRC